MGTASIRARWSVVALSACMLAGGALAQADEARAGREREALRRSQQALRAAQEKQALLERDKARLEAEKATSDAALKKATGEAGSAQQAARSARGALAQAQDEAQRLRAELDALRNAADKDRGDAQARIAELNAQLTEQRRSVAERTQANQSMSALVERSTRALATAEQNNAQLYGIGRQLVDRLRGAAEPPAPTARDPIVGFESIRLENEAEQIRSQLDPLRVKPLPPLPPVQGEFFGGGAALNRARGNDVNAR